MKITRIIERIAITLKISDGNHQRDDLQLNSKYIFIFIVLLNDIR